MIFFKRILVPIDFSSFSKDIVDKAVGMAVRCNSEELHFVGVMNLELVTQGLAAFPAGYVDNTVLEREIREARVRLSEIMDSYDNIGHIELFAQVLAGEFATSVCRYVKDHSIELIVMGAPSTHGLREFIFGNKAQAIAALAPCPVLTGREFAQHEIKKMIVPVEEFYPINKLHYAAILARLFSAEIHLVYLEQNAAGPESKTSIILRQISAQLDLLSIRHKNHGIAGVTNITEAILAYSEAAKIDLILVNPGEESKLTGRRLSPGGPQIVSNSPVPVLTIRKRKL